MQFHGVVAPAGDRVEDLLGLLDVVVAVLLEEEGVRADTAFGHDVDSRTSWERKALTGKDG